MPTASPPSPPSPAQRDWLKSEPYHVLILWVLVRVDAYPRYAASALAGNALVRCSFAGT